MKFGNPVSSVSITGGTVSVNGNVGITGTPTVDATGSNNLGLNNMPAGAISASNFAYQSLGVGSGGGSATLLAAVSGTRFLLIGMMITISPLSTGTQATLNINKSDGSGTLLTVGYTGTSRTFYIVQVPLYQLLLDNNVGLTMEIPQSTAGSTDEVTLFYSSTLVTDGTFTNPVVLGGS